MKNVLKNVSKRDVLKNSQMSVKVSGLSFHAIWNEK